uniref:PB1 domain-containing protein n=1 Tax=Brassica oleracea TaxID=3712 RepID=A0A3P6DH08_BRAOL|nr:unnamed protein product [Brassica oleracea]
MEPPLPSLSSTVVPAATSAIPPPPHVPSSYPESLDSSPKSRTTDAWDDLPPPGGGASSKLRLMCSYNGHILPRPQDKSLCYMGGDTRIIALDRTSSLSSLITRLSNTLLNGRSFTLKYQLPSEDLDSLISVTTDEDLDNMIEEYDRTISSAKPCRLRLFLFTAKPEATQSMGQILESSAKSDDWFLNRGFSDSDSDVNRLLGLDDTLRSNSGDKDDDGKHQQQKQQPPQHPGGQDVHNLPDSPMLDTSSSFGSTSSSPSLANLPPIRVHVEEARGMQDQRLGIEEQFARFNDGFAAISSPPPMPVTITLPAAPVNAPTVSSGVFSDDERSNHGVPAGYRKPPTQQVKSNSGGHEMPSPDSFSSDSSMSNSVFHQRPSVNQEPVSQMPSCSSTLVTGLTNPSDPNTLLSHHQNQDSSYILHPQQSQPQQQQFIHSPQYLHHHPSTGLPLQSYIQVYPSQPQQSFHMHPSQLDHQPYPFYYTTAPVPPKPYNMPLTQSGSVSDSLGSLPSSHPQTLPNSTMMAPPPNNHLRNTPQPTGGAQIVHQVPPISLQQFMGYSQIHHPPQSGSVGIPNYGYEYVENAAPKQVYYTQQMGHAQYQMVLADGSPVAAKLPAENMAQQIRSSQPM